VHLPVIRFNPYRVGFHFEYPRVVPPLRDNPGLNDSNPVGVGEECDGSFDVAQDRRGPPLHLNERAGEVAEQRPNPVAGVEERLAKDEHAEKDRRDDEGEEGPGPDVELVVGRRLGAHGGKVKGKGVKVKWGRLRKAKIVRGPSTSSG